MAKRGGGELTLSGAPPNKKLLTQFEPVKIGRVASLEDMDIKVLQFQNRKLVERIEQRRRAEDDLKRRIEQLEQRQATDDSMLCTVNRYWNQLDEDIRVLLQRFDAEVADETDIDEECEATTSFLSLLSQLDKNELDDKLSRRVEFSERSIGKLLHVFDRLIQRKDKLYEHVRTKEAVDKSDGLIKNSEIEIKHEPQEVKSILNESPILTSPVSPSDGKPHNTTTTTSTSAGKTSETLNEVVKQELEMLAKENKALHEQNSKLHIKHHAISLENSRLQDRLCAAETETAELKNQAEDLEYELTAARHKIDKMDRCLADMNTKLNTFQEGEIQVQGGGEGVSKNKFNEIAAELEEQRELATTRLGELEKLQEDHENLLKDNEKLKMDITMLPESVIIESTEYKCLQSQFSVLYNESLEMKNQLDEVRALLVTTKNAHVRQIEQMEVEELASQKRLRTEMIEMEDAHAQVRREYELLRMEYEQTIVANEQTGPINREMRNLISSLKNHNEQLKGEVQRFKRKLKEAQTDINKLRLEQQQQQTTGSTLDAQSEKKPDEEEGGSTSAAGLESAVEAELRMEIKKYQEKEKELKHLIDCYKNVSKEQREKAQLMASEKKYRAEVEELRLQIRRPSDADKNKQKKDDDTARRVKKLEETITDLQKSLAAQKQQEETMIGDMEVTGQAFEDMQEQNVRLLQQLREKDDANFKLMSERIKSNQMQKLLREEKELLTEQVETLQNQLEAQNVVVRKLEEKEAILVTTINTMDKEISLRQQSGELHKRKAIESAQTSADLKLHLDKYQSQLKDAQIVVTDKTTTLQQQTFKYKRMQEDIAALRRKLERVKKIESASSADEVLLEEIREYKEQSTCPSCKVRKKDAVLTKCFHVFCLDCLKTRYETRQRKCPKCNATFGANDYHRIYLE